MPFFNSSKSSKNNSSGSQKWYKGGYFSIFFKTIRILVVVFFVASIFGVILYRFVNPPFTWLMVQRGFERKAAGKEWKIDKQWRDFSEISDAMKRAAVAAEDQTFLENNGFDFNAIERAIEKNSKSKKLIGGSTITQQTAKNVFLWPGRSLIRKAFEAYFTVLIEIFWSKQRIMEVYLNEIEMGDGIYGVEAAAQAYFHKPASKLNTQEAAAIAVIFPSPLKWSAVHPTRYLRHRQYLIKKNMRRLGPLEF